MTQQAHNPHSGKTRSLVLTALLAAIEILMALTPIGYLKIGVVSVSLLMIPVSVGAFAMGTGCAVLLAVIFGLTSFIQCFGMDAFGSFLFALSPPAAFAICVIARAAAGFAAGLAAKLTKKLGVCSYAITGLTAALCNTVLFMGMLLLFFWHREAFLTKMNEWGFATDSVAVFLVAFVGFNCLFEAVVTSLTALAVGCGLNRAGLVEAVNPFAEKEKGLSES